ncbi:hypothetical protein BGX38DRAFT_1268365 [Terfezia claveryi]|nr:hypothetical protein BGX38DRAFT_1268365 [Terfezia claveryi]
MKYSAPNTHEKHATIPVPEVYTFDCRLDNMITGPRYCNGVHYGIIVSNGIAGDEQRGDEQLEERAVGGARSKVAYCRLSFYSSWGNLDLNKCWKRLKQGRRNLIANISYM